LHQIIRSDNGYQLQITAFAGKNSDEARGAIGDFIDVDMGNTNSPYSVIFLGECSRKDGKDGMRGSMSFYAQNDVIEWGVAPMFDDDGQHIVGMIAIENLSTYKFITIGLLQRLKKLLLERSTKALDSISRDKNMSPPPPPDPYHPPDPPTPSYPRNRFFTAGQVH
jgi:hypothetical protein